MESMAYCDELLYKNLRVVDGREAVFVRPESVKGFEGCFTVC